MKTKFLFFIFLGLLVVPGISAQLQHDDLSKLTPAELQEFEQTRSEAMRAPAVKSTRRIARMTLHNAMIKADPTIDTIFADMNAHVPKNQALVSHYKKSMGIKFSSWLGNYPPEAIAILTPANRQKLEAAHEKGLQDFSVISAIKTARITFYNAMINIDPKIIPILNKAGVAMPKSISRPSINSQIGSEEQILGGRHDIWDSEVLVPAVQKMQQKD